MLARCTAVMGCLAAAVLAAAALPAGAAVFTTSYTDGGNWSTVYAQGFSPSMNPNPFPGLSGSDPVNLTQFQFFKSGKSDSAADIRLAILNNLFANLQGLTTSSPSVVGLSTNTVASTASLASGDPITFSFNNLPLTFGGDYAAVFVNVGTNGELTPVLVSALTTNYVNDGTGTWHPQTNYGTENQYQYATSDYINTNQYGQFFSAYSFSGDSNFVATLATVPEPGAAVVMMGAAALLAGRRRGR